MSKLLSLSNSNSKNTSYNAKSSKNKNSGEIIKKNNFSQGSFNKSKGGEISSGNGSIESNFANITNNNSNNTNSNSNSNSISNNNISNNNNGYHSKNSITEKRKKFYDKLMKKDTIKKSNSNNLNNENGIKNNLNKIYDSEDFDSIKNIPNNQSTSSNIKITNNTNIILNVKSGTKSLDIRALDNNNDIIMRDMRELNLITKKAICSISNINPLLDTLDNFNEINKQRNISNNKVFNKKPMKELLINDNTDYNINNINQLLINNLTIDKKYNCLNNPNININFNNNKQTSSQIINIININGGNYSMDQTNKKPINNIPRKDLSSIKECSYDTPSYMSNTAKIPHIQKKSMKFKQYEFDTNNNIKQYKKTINKINKLPNKKYSCNNWHGNTINTASIKTNNNSSNNNNKNIKKYIEHLQNANKIMSNNTLKKGAFIDINKYKK